jgi:hypothetical protein
MRATCPTQEIRGDKLHELFYPRKKIASNKKLGDEGDVFWDVVPCSLELITLTMEAISTSETVQLSRRHSSLRISLGFFLLDIFP